MSKQIKLEKNEINLLNKIKTSPAIEINSTINSRVNFFKIQSGQSQEEWEKKGWIHKDDPRGWFEWYCKYFIGRRHEDDTRQIKRWLAFCGPSGRFRNTIYNKIYKSGLKIENSKIIIITNNLK